MLISRLYKSKNNPANNKQIPKPEQDTNLLFYVHEESLSKPKRSHFVRKNQEKYFPFLLFQNDLLFKRKFLLLRQASAQQEELPAEDPFKKT